MNWCRLCGEEKSPLDFSVELSDKTNSNWVYFDLIEHHTRVSLKSNKLLPQSICEDCRGQIESFADFSLRIQAVQNTFAVSGSPSEASEVITTSGDVPSRKLSHDQQSIETFFKSEFADVPSLKLQIEFLETEVLENGEVPTSSTEAMNLNRWSDFVSPCQSCQMPVDNFIELNMHRANFQNCQDSNIPCNLCSSNFKNVFMFLNHATSSHSEHLKHCCLMCDRIFYDLASLLSHFSSEHLTESLHIFQCLACGKFKDSIASLREHTSLSHGAGSTSSQKRTNEITTSEPTRPKRSRKEQTNEPTSLPTVLESFEVTESEQEEYSSSSDAEPKQIREKRRKPRPRKANNTQQGKANRSDVDTFEKLFAEEIKGRSKNQPSLHLNVSEDCKLPSGEVPEEYAATVSAVRWRNLLICGICKIEYNDIFDLLAHADFKHSTRSKLFNCQECKGEFTAVSESPLFNHMIERHYYEHLKFCCLICSKMFYNLPFLIAHYKTHTKKFDILICLICGWYAKNLEDLKEHKSLHSSSEKSENQLFCEKVYEKFKSGLEPSGRNHCVLEFERKPDGTVTAECQDRFVIDWSFGRYECSSCSMTFENPFKIFVHQRLKHQKDFFKKIYSCSLCTDKKDFTNLFTFVNHATTKHLDNAKFVCICCSKVFWNYLALADHYKNVHPTFPCIFCCHCGKIFMNVSVASSHFRTLNLLRTPEERKLLKEGKILEEMSHICHVCARSFKNRGTLLNHVKIHETIEPSELLQCHICSKFYKNKYKLAQHMVCHEDLRSWKCKACGQAFNYKKLLQRHIQAVHENERAFGCTFCEKRFNSKYDLKVHVRLHTGEMPYPCPIPDCDAKYPAWSNLFKHCQSRHKMDIRSDGYKKLKATQKSQKNVDEYETD